MVTAWLALALSVESDLQNGQKSMVSTRLTENKSYKYWIVLKEVMSAKHTKIIEIVTKKKIEPDFEPSMKTLSRILKTMINKGPEAKTSLSLDTNLNYTRLAKHIVWLEKKGLVKSTIDGSKINVGLTANGRIFALTILKTR